MNNYKNNQSHKCAVCGKELTLERTFFYHCHSDVKKYTKTDSFGLFNNNKIIHHMESYKRVDVGICIDCRKKMIKGNKLKSTIKYAIVFLVLFFLALFISYKICDDFILFAFMAVFFGLFLISYPLFKLAKFIAGKITKRMGYFQEVSVEDGMKSNSIREVMIWDSAPEQNEQGYVACALASHYDIPIDILSALLSHKKYEETYKFYSEITGKSKDDFDKLIKTKASFAVEKSRRDGEIDESIEDLFQDKLLGISR